MRVLLSRGLNDAETIRQFCEPKLTSLHDPGLMPNIDIAAARIVDAVRRDQLIAIYGDYDVDGVTAAAILWHTIKTAHPGARIRTYIPHRLEEGYGLNSDALRQLKSEGVDLVITVDCGISAIGPARTARDIGLELIITDHHNLPPAPDASAHPPLAPGSAGGAGDSPTLPDALAIIHPRLPGSAYPFGELCGAGVAFKLAWRFATTWCNSQRVSESLQHTLIQMLPLAALGTIADVVPLVGENRIIASHGLRLMPQTPLPGLLALMATSSLVGEKIDSQQVGFVLGPRLNACGRMGHAAAALKLLTDATPMECQEIARQLGEQNQHRQGVEKTILELACRMAEDSGQTRDDRRVICLAHESWHPGVVGIVCARLVDRFGRPAILMNKQRDLCKGSARSIEGYSIHEALAAGAQHLTTWGGHAAAAGLTLPTDKLEAFVQAVTEHANAHIAIDQLLPALTIDCDATLDELDLPTVQRLHALSPFGNGNRSPTLRVMGATIIDPPKQMGAQGKHLQLRLKQDNIQGRGKNWIRAVWWSAGPRANDLAPGMRLDLAIEPRINEWNGQRNVEAQLCDVRVCEAAP